MNVKSFRWIGLTCLMAIAISSLPRAVASENEPVFSGPQVGEKLMPFEVLSVSGETAGTNVDPVKLSKGQPLLMIFVHKLTRPGMGLTRALTAYALSQKEHNVSTQIVWLDNDQAAAEAYLTRASGSLQFTVPVGVSVDGGEGPGAYGLNRNVELTILVAKEHVVQANYALVQPSVTEAAKIASELAKLIDQPMPDQTQLEKLAYPGGMMQAQAMRKPSAPSQPGNTQGNELREMMKELIARDVTEDSSEELIAKIDDWAGKNPSRKTQLAKMVGAIIERGMGSDRVQPQLKKWLQDSPAGKPTEQPAKNPR